VRPRAALTLAAAVLAAGIGASACSSSGGSDSLGHQACVDVSRSIATYNSAAHQTPADAATTRTKALNELRSAVRPAALASASDTDWQALTATLSESERVPEDQLISALQAQCAATLSSG
jgi:hypothetical protein